MATGRLSFLSDRRTKKNSKIFIENDNQSEKEVREFVNGSIEDIDEKKNSSEAFQHQWLV